MIVQELERTAPTPTTSAVLRVEIDGHRYDLFWSGKYPMLTVVSPAARRHPARFAGKTFHSPVELGQHYRRHGAILRDLTCEWGVWS